MQISQYWHEISHLGVTDEQEDSLQKSVILANRFAMVLSLIFVISAGISLWQLRDPEVVAFFLGMAIVSGLVPVFNRQGHTMFSLIFLSTVVPVSVLLEAIYAKTLHPDYLTASFYYLPRFFILSSIILPLVLIDIRQRRKFWGTIAVVLLCLLAYDPLHNAFNVGYNRLQLQQQSGLLNTSADLILIALFVSAFIFLRNLNIRFERQVESLFEDIQHSNEILHDKQEQIQQAYDKLKETSHELQNKNDKITDSLRYAQNIQRTILPTPQQLQQAFSDHFTLYRSKDLVSGDFYWLDVASAEETGSNDKIFVGVIDCTGHGVPGAFMSMTGNTLLHEIIDKLHVYDTARVLDLLDERLKTAFKDRANRYHGMDVALCMIEEQDENNYRVLYSGAKRPLFYYLPTDQNIHMLRGVNKSVGDRHRRKANRSFSTEELLLPKGSVLYLTSDGLVDQGNPEGEKFGTPRLMDYLRAYAALPLAQQHNHLQRALDKHQEEATQRDDITLLAIQI